MTSAQTKKSDWLRKAMGNITSVLTVKYQLLLGTSIMLIPLILLSLYSKTLFTEAIDEFDEVVEKIERQMNSVMRLNHLILKAPMPANDWLIHGDIKEKTNFENLSRQINDAFYATNSIEYNDPRIYKILAQSKSEWIDARQKANKIFSIKTPRETSARATMMEDMDAQFDNIARHLDKAFTMIETDIKISHTAAHAAKKHIQMYAVVILLAGFIASIATAFFLSELILKPINKIKEGALRLSSGDMGYRIDCYRNDELGELGNMFNHMADMLEEDQKVLQQQAVHDELTGLFNRREFYRRMEEEIKRSGRYLRSLSIMMLDLDHFKKINDTYGHTAGDQVLREVAHRLTSIVRPIDTVIRYGGEEFTVMLPETAVDDAKAMAERIRSFMETNAIMIGDNEPVTLTISIGVAEFNADTMTISDFVSSADNALYTAKNSGRNRVCVSA